MRFRLEDPNGAPLTAADGIEIRTTPETLTDIPDSAPSPAGFTASVSGDTVHLSWINDGGYDELFLFRQDSAGNSVRLIPVGSDDAAYAAGE